MINENDLSKSASKISYYRASNIKISRNISLVFNRLNEYYKTPNSLKFEKKITELENLNHILENNSDKFIYILQKNIAIYKEEARKNAQSFKNIYNRSNSNVR